MTNFDGGPQMPFNRLCSALRVIITCEATFLVDIQSRHFRKLESLQLIFIRNC